MGIFDFLKRKKQNIDIELPMETIQFNELGTQLQIKESELADKELDLLAKIKEQLNKLTKELEEEIETLKKIDLDDKPKIEERVKLIVKGNLDSYINYLEKLIETLKNLNPQLNIIPNKINSIFSEFERKSNLSYQKATFLVGKELEKTKVSIADFFRNLKITLDENKNLIMLSQTVSIVNEKLKEIDANKKQKMESQGSLDKFNQKILDFEDKINTIKKEIEDTKKSKEHKEELKTKQTILNKEQELEKEILQIKAEIDFKSLANLFHTNKKEMEIIKEHKEMFKKAFQKSNGEEILELLNGAKVDTETISKKISETNIIKQEIEELEKAFNPEHSKNILTKEFAITKIKEDIENVNYENTREKNKYERFNKDEQEIIDKIKQELGKINVGLNEKV